MKRMLINATQQEELRVALVDGQKLYDLHIESASTEQKKGNIYKGKITRIEPSLEAAFIDYGSDRHGFLPLKEITKEYCTSPVEKNKSLNSKHGIKDFIKENQELIIQIDKEERGNKGAALTTFISLAGSYLVLMPNNPSAGGISRRIEGEEREELKTIRGLLEAEVPKGMGFIIRTAGVGKSIEDLKWDLISLLRLWDVIKKTAETKIAPAIIHQESNVIFRALRDYLRHDIDEILIDDATVFALAIKYIKALGRPDFVKKIKLYKNRSRGVPLFSAYQIESQIESAFQREVILPSGGSIVIDSTEALTAIDINSARATSGKDIEDTAFNTNLQAVEEIARQLRLRDLGGLIVIDFIDMSQAQHQRQVEDYLWECVKIDRARIELGTISRFGLLEMSRQRIKPSLRESSYHRCPYCDGTGIVRETESLALAILRLIEEESLKPDTQEVHAIVPVDIACYLLNEKREAIANLEKRHGSTSLVIVPNVTMRATDYNIIRMKMNLSPLIKQKKILSYMLPNLYQTQSIDTNKSHEQEYNSKHEITRHISGENSALKNDKRAVNNATQPNSSTNNQPLQTFRQWLKAGLRLLKNYFFKEKSDLSSVISNRAESGVKKVYSTSGRDSTNLYRQDNRRKNNRVPSQRASEPSETYFSARNKQNQNQNRYKKPTTTQPTNISSSGNNERQNSNKSSVVNTPIPTPSSISSIKSSSAVSPPPLVALPKQIQQQRVISSTKVTPPQNSSKLVVIEQKSAKQQEKQNITSTEATKIVTMSIVEPITIEKAAPSLALPPTISAPSVATKQNEVVQAVPALKKVTDRLKIEEDTNSSVESNNSAAEVIAVEVVTEVLTEEVTSSAENSQKQERQNNFRSRRSPRHMRAHNQRRRYSVDEKAEEGSDNSVKQSDERSEPYLKANNEHHASQLKKQPTDSTIKIENSQHEPKKVVSTIAARQLDSTATTVSGQVDPFTPSPVAGASTQSAMINNEDNSHNERISPTIKQVVDKEMKAEQTEAVVPASGQQKKEGNFISTAPATAMKSSMPAVTQVAPQDLVAKNNAIDPIATKKSGNQSNTPLSTTDERITDIKQKHPVPLNLSSAKEASLEKRSSTLSLEKSVINSEKERKEGERETATISDSNSRERDT